MSIPEIPSSKVLGFLFFGVILYIGSTYMNIIKPNFGLIGVWLSIILIVIAIIVQVGIWIQYFRKRY